MSRAKRKRSTRRASDPVVVQRGRAADRQSGARMCAIGVVSNPRLLSGVSLLQRRPHAINHRVPGRELLLEVRE